MTTLLLSLCLAALIVLCLLVATEIGIARLLASIRDRPKETPAPLPPEPKVIHVSAPARETPKYLADEVAQVMGRPLSGAELHFLERLQGTHTPRHAAQKIKAWNDRHSR